MGLIGNRTILGKLPLYRYGGTLAADIRTVDNWHIKENANPQSSIPSGYYAGGAWLLPQVSGGMAAFSGVDGDGALNFANLAGGLNAQSSITGSGDIIFAQAGLIVSAVALISGSSTFSADIIGTLNASASLAGQGQITASLGALASAVANITGNSSISVTPYATGNMSALIRSYGDLTPEGIASAVWNSIAAQFNTAGTMGAKVNSAASAGDPWSTILPGSYVDGEAGKILSQIQTLVERLHRIQGLEIGVPSTTDRNTGKWTAGDIELDISGDLVNETTIEAVS